MCVYVYIHNLRGMFDARIGFHPASSHPLRRLTSWTRLDTTHHHKGCNEDGSKRVELHVCEVPKALHLPWFARFHTFTPWRSWMWLTSDKVTSQQHDIQVDLQQERPKKDGRLCRLCTWSFNFRASWIRHKLQPLGRQTEDGVNRGWKSGVESKSSMTIRSGSKILNISNKWCSWIYVQRSQSQCILIHF